LTVNPVASVLNTVFSVTRHCQARGASISFVGAADSGF
jgi:hypothetical protein